MPIYDNSSTNQADPTLANLQDIPPPRLWELSLAILLLLSSRKVAMRTVPPESVKICALVETFHHFVRYLL